jgi:glycosyltransferase involved in cell wall biosynthesis
VTRLGLRPWRRGDNPPPGSVPVTVVVLTCDEEVNIARCLDSVAWAQQAVVIDSGSSDNTVPLARSLGADVVRQTWLGFSGQREFALRLPEIRNDWIYFVDADEWVSPQLALEIAAGLDGTDRVAFSHRLRLVFLNTWIRHCGWYSGSWVVRLVDRRHAKYDGSLVGERAHVDGAVGRLENDIVDEDRKGLASWLHKHVRYAELEQRKRGQPVPMRERLRRFRGRDRTDTRPLARVILKDLVFPAVPARPLALFLYMYVIRLGLLDGRAGLRFCFFHAWFQAAVDGLQSEALRKASRPGTPGPASYRNAGLPRLGVLATHPIQYQAPLYQRLARRGIVDLEVAFLSSAGVEPFHDPGFGVTLAWDIDLLGGYRSTVLERRPLAGKGAWLVSASRWLRQQDIVVLHGHSDPDMLLAAAACRLLGVPYLLRGDSQAQSSASGPRRIARHLVAGAVVRNAAGALPIGHRNAAFYRRYGRIPHYLAPYSVDNERFEATSGAARPARDERLASLGLDPGRPTVIFAGKLIAQKRPLDLVHAIERTGPEFNLLVLGDGPLRSQVHGYEGALPVRCLGFINQAELPRWYGCGDILALPSDREPWGLVVNEGMACGLIPVVSDAVGCGPDLVRGVGEVFPAGDVDALATALRRVARDIPGRRERLATRLAGFTSTTSADGYEQAAIALGRRRRP